VTEQRFGAGRERVNLLGGRVVTRGQRRGQVIDQYEADKEKDDDEGFAARRGDGDGEPRSLDLSQGAMRSALNWSWDLLTSAERSAFAQCAVFRGGFTMDAAEAVLRVPESPASILSLVQEPKK